MRLCVWIVATALCLVLLAGSGCKPKGDPVASFTPPETSPGAGKKPNVTPPAPIKID